MESESEESERFQFLPTPPLTSRLDLVTTRLSESEAEEEE